MESESLYKRHADLELQWNSNQLQRIANRGEEVIQLAATADVNLVRYKSRSCRQLLNSCAVSLELYSTANYHIRYMYTLSCHNIQLNLCL